MPRYGNFPGRTATPGMTRGWPLKVGRRQSRTLRWLCGHRRLRGQEGTRPGRISRARNVETSSGSTALLWRCGQPTVRKAQLPGGNRTPKKLMPAAERQQESAGRGTGPPTGCSAYNWPDTGPGARPRKRADVRRVSLETKCRCLPEPRDKLDTHGGERNRGRGLELVRTAYGDNGADSSSGLLEPCAATSGMHGSEGAPVQQCTGATRLCRRASGGAWCGRPGIPPVTTAV
jgi:hypothetical protein